MDNIFVQYKIMSCDRMDNKYPNSLKKLTGMPPLLYYKGDIEILNRHKNIAVIGSRKSSLEGRKLAFETGCIVAELGMNIVNGLALGCDAQAFKGALSVGGKCVAIMPCGLEQIQPKSNYGLAEEILEKGGCLISQYPVGAAVREYQYVERDRLQSGVSQGVLIVEAQAQSGTMHTANFAMKQYRRLACYCHQIVNMASGNKLLEENGKANILRTERDLRTFLKEVSQEEIFEQIVLDFG